MSAEDVNKKISPRDFMIQRLGLDDLANDSSFRIHGYPAHTGTSLVKTSDGQRIGRFTVLYQGTRAFIFIGMTKNPQDISKYDKDFLDTAKSFHALTDTERKLAQPLQIKVVSSGGENMAELAKNSPVEKYAEEYLRLLNHHYPTGEPNKGELLKIIE